jgi:hypothetical protein
MVTRPCTTFPPPPLKFRTAGFPQYGFKPDRSSVVFAWRSFTTGLCTDNGRGAARTQGSRTGSGWASAYLGLPAQRPLARHRVVLSQRVIAYYGLIRASGPLPPSYSGLRRRVFALRARGQRVPNLSCLSLDPCRHLCPGGRAAQDCCTSARSGLRPHAHERGVRNYSAKSRFTAGRDFEAYGSSLSATARIVASPSPTRAFTFELSDHESPLWYVEHNYAAKQSIAAAGLSPARQAAVWAANASRDGPSGGRAAY